MQNRNRIYGLYSLHAMWMSFCITPYQKFLSIAITICLYTFWKIQTCVPFCCIALFGKFHSHTIKICCQQCQWKLVFSNNASPTQIHTGTMRPWVWPLCPKFGELVKQVRETFHPLRASILDDPNNMDRQFNRWHHTILWPAIMIVIQLWHQQHPHSSLYNTLINWRAPWKNRTSRYISLFSP